MWYFILQKMSITVYSFANFTLPYSALKFEKCTISEGAAKKKGPKKWGTKKKNSKTFILAFVSCKYSYTHLYLQLVFHF